MHDDFIVVGTCQFAIDEHLHPKLYLLIGHRLAVNRKSKGIVNGNRLISGKIGENNGVLGHGDMLVLHHQDRRNATNWCIKNVIERKRQGDRLARIEPMVVVFQSVVDGKTLISDAAQRNGFDGGQRIHAAEAINIALASLNRDCRFLQNPTNLGRGQIMVFAQHECHATRHTGRSHRSATHIDVSMFIQIVQRLDIYARGTHIGTNQAKSGGIAIIVRIVVENIA